MLDKLKSYFFKTCDKTKKIKGVKFSNTTFSYLLLPVLGLLATIWILVRVLPKPSRLRYPCMKVAVPFSSSFLVFMAGILASVFSYQKVKALLKRERVNIPVLILFVAAGFFGLFLTLTSSSRSGYAEYGTIYQAANQPTGEAQGIFPGRVVWVHAAEATNENCTLKHNGDGVANENDDGWFLNRNNNQDVIDQMLSDALQALGGMSTDKASWDTLFKYHNVTRGKGAVNYQEGEKIFIKINVTSSWGMGFNWGNIRNDFSVAENSYYGVSETSPQLVLSALRQLVNVVGISQNDIYIGDPMKHIYKHCYDLWYSEFPDVHYLDHDRDSHGREVFVPSETAIIDYSDRGTCIPEQIDHLYQIFEACEYLINIPTMKGHVRAGITMFGKNHFGSNTRDGADHLHSGLVNPDGKPGNGDERLDYGKYRVQVDLLAHELLGGKSLFYLMDALWAAGMEINPPSKWQMSPFNNDWCSSIFISQDPVAIESVGYDFLRAEYTVLRHPSETHVQMQGTDDYLHQAADSSNWPEGITYDPENDGTPIASLGVHEHWNNPQDKQYSRNLGTGNGIELKIVSPVTVVEECPVQTVETFALHAYPNPFNPSVNIMYTIKEAGVIDLSVYNLLGQKVITINHSRRQPGSYTEKVNFGQFGLASGSYIVHLQTAKQLSVRKVSYCK